ncbi:MAG: hypothetical protein WKF94_05890 [Solirubrobacteraceae bacterium]
MRLPFVVIAVMLAVLIPVGFASDSGSGEPSVPAVQLAPVAVIAERVEKLRGLNFDTAPEPVTVSKEQAIREGLADLDRAYPPEARRADEALYIRLGLLPPGTDLREVSASIFGDQVAGYYDPRTKDLRLVEGAAGTRVTNEMIISHELVHALEDQAVGLDLAEIERSDDPAYAYKALVEGTATNVMYEYVDTQFDAQTGLAGILSDGLNAPSTLSLPPFLVEQLTFPYVAGEQFVEKLYGTGGSWQLVDVALRDRPPSSTEQILHPDKWLQAEEPVEVDAPSPGPGWKTLTSGVFGEWQTRQLLALGGRVQFAAAAGWGGDRYALYERGSDQALAMRWIQDTAKDSREFVDALTTYVEDGIGAQRAGDAYRLDDTTVAIGTGEAGVTLVFAPDLALARRLADLD